MADLTGIKQVWPHYSSVNSSGLRQTGGALGKDDFLKILLTQLQHQDPMQPMQDTEFIAQMAQFTSLEQMTNIASEVSLLRQSLGFSSSLIGKSVSWDGWNDEGEVELKTGIVNAIIVREGRSYAEVNGEMIPLEYLIRISQQEAVEDAG